MVSLCEMTLANWPTPSRVLTEKPGLRLDLPSFATHQRKVVSGVKKNTWQKETQAKYGAKLTFCVHSVYFLVPPVSRKKNICVVDYGRIGRFFVSRWNRIWVVVSNIVVSTLLLEMIQFDDRIFSKWVGEKPPTRTALTWHYQECEWSLDLLRSKLPAVGRFFCTSASHVGDGALKSPKLFL